MSLVLAMVIAIIAIRRLTSAVAAGTLSLRYPRTTARVTESSLGTYRTINLLDFLIFLKD